MEIGGVIVAGGRATRMNRETKPLVKLRGITLVEHVIARARPQVDHLVLNVNQHAEKFASLQLPIIGDRMPAQTGPLLGIASAMAWYLGKGKNQQVPLLEPEDTLACFPADVPFFPDDIVNTLQSRMKDSNAEVALCRSGEQLQPLFSLWSLQLHDRIEACVLAGYFGPKQVYEQFSHVIVDIDSTHPGIFFNINSPEDLRQAEALAGVKN